MCRRGRQPGPGSNRIRALTIPPVTDPQIQVTTILPCINVGWIVQWYLNVPTFLNTRPKAAPGASTPESHKPLFEVVVWLTVPLFVHLTFVPFAMVIVLGLKAKLTIFTRSTEVAASREAVFL